MDEIVSNYFAGYEYSRMKTFSIPMDVWTLYTQQFRVLIISITSFTSYAHHLYIRVCVQFYKQTFTSMCVDRWQNLISVRHDFILHQKDG